MRRAEPGGARNTCARPAAERRRGVHRTHHLTFEAVSPRAPRPPQPPCCHTSPRARAAAARTRGIRYIVHLHTATSATPIRRAGAAPRSRHWLLTTRVIYHLMIYYWGFRYNPPFFFKFAAKSTGPRSLYRSENMYTSILTGWPPEHVRCIISARMTEPATYSAAIEHFGRKLDFKTCNPAESTHGCH